MFIILDYIIIIVQFIMLDIPYSFQLLFGIFFPLLILKEQPLDVSSNAMNMRTHGEHLGNNNPKNVEQIRKRIACRRRVDDINLTTWYSELLPLWMFYQTPRVKLYCHSVSHQTLKDYVRRESCKRSMNICNILSNVV